MINDDLIVQKIPRENPSTVYDGPPPFSREAFSIRLPFGAWAPLKGELASRRLD